ncbi:DHA2 family efflux MFS transporter permease subunit [Pseudonocardia eucalypti]|uniref:DHA2 family efflux MFS transporter permease subunit n=1 Tax=Pseudonocardia eucalypti TaxID=648755 RepID=A0ABP9R163_9PSEU|nr:EmrB/QacA subfamily drug resistance transporter [Pseudonocardia eucalypti]
MEVVAAGPAQTSNAPAAGEKWALPLIVLIVGMFAVVLDTTIVNVAIPHIQRDIGASAKDVEWIATAYNLALGMVVPLAGWLGDRIGLSRLYALSLVAFAVTSVLCGLAWDLPSLVVFRVLQAVPGGILPVISVTMLYRIVPPEKIGSAMGMYGLGVVFAPAIGPTLGGWLLEHTTWPAIFFINGPIGLIGAVATLAVFPRIRPTTWPKFDLIGFVTVAYGLFAILLASSEGKNWGWDAYPTLILFATGGLSLALFVVIELEIENPLLDLRVFKSWVYTNSVLLVVVLMIGLNAVLFYLPLFMQEGQGYTALHTGLVLLPEAMALVVMMPIAGRLYDMFGARIPAVIGLVIATYGTYLLMDLSPNTTEFQYMWWTALRAVGVAMAMMPIMTAGLSALPPEMTGAGSGWNNVGQRVSAALGLAGFGVFVNAQQQQMIADRSALISPADAGSVPGLREALDQGVQGLYGIYAKLQVDVLAQTYADVFFIATLLTGAAVGLAFMLPHGAPNAAGQPARPAPEPSPAEESTGEPPSPAEPSAGGPEVPSERVPEPVSAGHR